MTFMVIFKPLAQAEAADAFAWYAQSHIQMGDVFWAEMEHTSSFLSRNPVVPCFDGVARRKLIRKTS